MDVHKRHANTRLAWMRHANTRLAWMCTSAIHSSRNWRSWGPALFKVATPRWLGVLGHTRKNLRPPKAEERSDLRTETGWNTPNLDCQKTATELHQRQRTSKRTRPDRHHPVSNCPTRRAYCRFPRPKNTTYTEVVKLWGTAASSRCHVNQRRQSFFGEKRLSP